ncbi:MAG: hypothetical protein ACTTI6_07350 [Treponema sp.]|uniref:hypothetical protein n=1 Tax=Treponema sp. TaxID=166 RepID=UPI003FA2E781
MIDGLFAILCVLIGSFGTYIVTIVNNKANEKANQKIIAENRKQDLYQRRLKLYEDLLEWHSTSDNFFPKNTTTLAFLLSLMDKNIYFEVRCRMYATQEVLEIISTITTDIHTIKNDFEAKKITDDDAAYKAAKIYADCLELLSSTIREESILYTLQIQQPLAKRRKNQKVFTAKEHQLLTNVNFLSKELQEIKTLVFQILKNQQR